MVEAMRHAYVDRNFALGDPDFVEEPARPPPVQGLCRRDPRRRSIPDKAATSKDVQPGVAAA